ncbi:MAG: hypothetical protein Kow0098_02480 [Ignavibacteriaceae bacterium]
MSIVKRISFPNVKRNAVSLNYLFGSKIKSASNNNERFRRIAVQEMSEIKYLNTLNLKDELVASVGSDEGKALIIKVK